MGGCVVLVNAIRRNLPMWFAILVYLQLKMCCFYSLMMCQNTEELRKMANWAGVKGGSREHLMDSICGKDFSLLHTSMDEIS